MDKFDLEYQFKFYLEKVKLNPDNMSPVQLEETRQAFISGFSSMMILNTEIGKMPFEKSSVIIGKIFKQMTEYWNSKMPGKKNFSDN